jgi:hypothetical protein
MNRSRQASAGGPGRSHAGARASAGGLALVAVLSCSGPVIPADATTTDAPAAGSTSTGDEPEPGDSPAATAAPTTSGDAGTPGSTGPADTGTGETTDTAPPTCGNGVVDPPETCDFGIENNWDGGACTSQCQRARCGDGLLFQGVEGCDDGEDNAVGYAKCDPVTCQPGPHCGDGQLAPEEECDASGPDGGGEIDGVDTPCRPGCTWDGRVMFVSSAAYDGDLGGLTGADLKCQNLAQAAHLQGYAGFRAWLSDGEVGPLDRLDFGPGAVVLLDGTRLAPSLAELISLGPDDGVRVTEQRTTMFDARVWTNTAVNGEVFSATDHCDHWTVADKTDARCGYNAVPALPADLWTQWRAAKAWTSHSTWKCSQVRHLYCIEAVES